MKVRHDMLLLLLLLLLRVCLLYHAVVFVAWRDEPLSGLGNVQAGKVAEFLLDMKVRIGAGWWLYVLLLLLLLLMWSNVAACAISLIWCCMHMHPLRW
jgi:hypothetical protein